MSIIADALRKAESPSPASPPGPGSPRSDWLLRVLLLGCVAGAAAGLFKLARGAQPARQAPLPPTGSATPQPTPAPVLPLKELRGHWALQGVLRGGGAPMALINNQVVQEGEQIEGKRLVRVDPDSVDLQDEGGQIRTLRLGQD